MYVGGVGKASLRSQALPAKEGENLGMRLGEPGNEARQKVYLEEVCH